MASDARRGETFMIEVPEDKTLELLELFNADFRSLADCIDIVDRKLIITRPKVATSLNRWI